jgi:hypothetical protein
VKTFGNDLAEMASLSTTRQYNSKAESVAEELNVEFRPCNGWMIALNSFLVLSITIAWCL